MGIPDPTFSASTGSKTSPLEKKGLPPERGFEIRPGIPGNAKPRLRCCRCSGADFKSARHCGNVHVALPFRCTNADASASTTELSSIKVASALISGFGVCLISAAMEMGSVF